MKRWISVKKRLPDEGQIVWARFEGKWKRTEMVMYTPNFIATLCREDEGQWKGMSSTDEDDWMYWTPVEPPELE